MISTDFWIKFLNLLKKVIITNKYITKIIFFGLWFLKFYWNRFYDKDSIQ